MTVAVELRGVTKRYAERAVVCDVSFEVAAGECVAILGPNGAGKTTTIRMVTCFTPPDAGTITVAGWPVVPRNHRRIKRALGVVHQQNSLDPDLTVAQNLSVYARYFGIGGEAARRRTDELVHFAALEGHRQAPIRTLSGGMKRRLMLARALLHRPPLLVLDEPTTGLDPQARRLVWERIRTLKREGTTVLLTTHYMDEAERLSDRLIVMDGGRLVVEGPAPLLVRTHVGAEVVEIPAADAAGVRIPTGLGRVERVGDVVYWYLPEGDVRSAVDAALGERRVVRRPASLEDVFLTITGHALRD